MHAQHIPRRAELRKPFRPPGQLYVFSAAASASMAPVTSDDGACCGDGGGARAKSQQDGCPDVMNAARLGLVQQLKTALELTSGVATVAERDADGENRCADSRPGNCARKHKLAKLPA